MPGEVDGFDNGFLPADFVFLEPLAVVVVGAGSHREAVMVLGPAVAR